jgi:hypothetical protein
MVEFYEHGKELSCVSEGWEYYDQLGDYQISINHFAAAPSWSLLARCGYGLST